MTIFALLWEFNVDYSIGFRVWVIETFISTFRNEMYVREIEQVLWNARKKNEKESQHFSESPIERLLMTSNFSLVFDPSTARIYLRTFRKQKLRAQSRPIHVNFMLNCFLPACCLRNLIQGSNPFYFFFHPYVFLYSGIFMLFSLFTFFTKIDSAA